MTVISVISQFGAAVNSSFAARALADGVTWDTGFLSECALSNSGLTVENLPGAGQGVCVPPQVAQNAGAGIVYFECKWDQLGSPDMAGGIGLISLEALAAVNSPASLAEAYGALAADGTGGLILRPDGSVWHAGSTSGPIAGLAQSQGDTIGIMVNFPPTADLISVNIFGVGGSVSGHIFGSTFIAYDSYVPCVAFGNDLEGESVTANFGGINLDSLLGPTVFPDSFEGVFLGWPNRA